MCSTIVLQLLRKCFELQKGKNCWTKFCPPIAKIFRTIKLFSSTILQKSPVDTLMWWKSRLFTFCQAIYHFLTIYCFWKFHFFHTFLLSPSLWHTLLLYLSLRQPESFVGQILNCQLIGPLNPLCTMHARTHLPAIAANTHTHTPTHTHTFSLWAFCLTSFKTTSFSLILTLTLSISHTIAHTHFALSLSLSLSLTVILSI